MTKIRIKTHNGKIIERRAYQIVGDRTQVGIHLYKRIEDDEVGQLWESVIFHLPSQYI